MKSMLQWLTSVESISGIDIAIDYTIETENWGTFVPKLDVSMVDEYMMEDYLGGPMVDKVGRNGLPEFRGLLTLNWYREEISQVTIR